LYQYDAWGNELLTQVSAPRPPPSENPYRWCGALGYYRDRDAQMYLLGMRWYDPQTGRFISRDPIGFAGGDANLRRYVGNSPVIAVDLLGLQRSTGQPWTPVVCMDEVERVLRACSWLLKRNVRNAFYSCCLDAGNNRQRGTFCVLGAATSCALGRIVTR
jgi:RHS repeat-associated protein